MGMLLVSWVGYVVIKQNLGEIKKKPRDEKSEDI